MRFRYEALNADGDTIRGDLEAEQLDRAIDQLRDQGLLPLTVEEGRAVATGGGFRLFGPRKISNKQILMLTQQMAKLLKAGLPLDRTLSVLMQVGDDPAVATLLGKIQEQVRAGRPLAESLEQQQTFSRFYLNMVRAGEAGGSLEQVLDRLAVYLERTKALRESVVSALIYPAILFVVAAGSVIALLMFVVPQFEQLFADAGRALPVPTQIVIAAGDALRLYWWAILLGITALYLLMKQQLSPSSYTRPLWDALFLRLPLFGDLIAKLETARFARTLGTLLGNGVPLLTALSIVRETLTNHVLSQCVAEVSENLKAGQGLAQPLLEAGKFPPLAVHMMRVGEETGDLQDMLVQVAETYDAEVQTTVKRLLTLLEPVLILTMGLLIAGIIVSILMAILSVNSLAF